MLTGLCGGGFYPEHPESVNSTKAAYIIALGERKVNVNLNAGKRNIVPEEAKSLQKCGSL